MKSITIIFIITLLTGTAYWQFNSVDTAQSFTWVEVERKEFQVYFSEKGIVAPSKISRVQSSSGGTLISLMEQGKEVVKGDAIAKVDTSNYKETIATFDSQLKTLLTSLDINKTDITLAKLDGKNLQEGAKKSWEYTVKLRDYEFSLPEKKTLRQLAINLELKKLDLEESQSNLKRQQNLYDKGFLSKVALETYQRKLMTDKERLKEARLNIVISKKGISEERRVELEQKVLRARDSMDRSEKRMRRRVVEYEDILKVTEQKIEVLHFKRNDLLKKLEQSTSYAQQSGFLKIFKYKDWRSSGSFLSYAAGVTVYEKDVIAEVIDPRKMKVNLIFNESDYHLLKLDVEVEIIFPALPGKRFNGKLTSIGAIGKDRNMWLEELSGTSGVAMYNGEILIEASELLRPGMSAICKIIIEQKKEGLLIPRQALILDKGKTYVFRDQQKVEVQGRNVNELQFEVSSGLKEKDRVRLPAGATK
jgi:multidrug efflux pump subunit AcrA (membrane-fusion protein)